VKLIDPSAFTPPYDRALAAALAAEGADVELITSKFSYGPVPEPRGYDVSFDFYRHTGKRARRLTKAISHVPDMRRLSRRLAAEPEGTISHYQWLTLPRLDRRLIAGRRPRVMTAHYILPPVPTAGQVSEARRTFGAMDAVIAHSRRGAERLVGEVGLPAERVRVIPHGAFDYLAELPDRGLPPELAEEPGEKGPVILFFGLLRPYKGIDVLLEAVRGMEPGPVAPELWIVGNPRMDLGALRSLAERSPIRVRWLTRFIEDPEIPALMNRADLLVLPYTDGEQSGVLYTGIAFGKAMVVSEVGGIGEVAAEHGLARLVPPGDPDALRHELEVLTGPEGPTAREELATRSRQAAAGPFAWGTIAGQTMDLYEEVSS